MVTALLLGASGAGAWEVLPIAAPGPVVAIARDGTAPRVAIGPDWYQLAENGRGLVPAAPPPRPVLPAGALADGRVATGSGGIVRAWLAEPTTRYAHGVLGDAVEAGSLVVERGDGRRVTISAGPDAVFEDLEPRVARLDGTERIVVVKSYLARGAALAVVDAGRGAVIAETPPIGRPNAWLNPAGIADFDGDGTVDIALVRQPHVVGVLELWSWRDGALQKRAALEDASNHAIGSRALGLAVAADLDGDGTADLAIPSLDRRTLRLIAFRSQPREIARLKLPARVATDTASVVLAGRPALLVGLESGELVLVRD